MKTVFLESKRIRDWSVVSPFRNLLFLLIDLMSACLVLAGVIAFFELRGGWGLHWLWCVPAGFLSILLVGAIQHRIALMGHEASHYLVHPNRRLNDAIAELFCFSPLFAIFSQYRARHLAHHLYTNDPDRDTNLAGRRAEKLYAKFPMEEDAFLRRFFLKFLWPPAVLSNFFDLLRVALVDTGFSLFPGNQVSGAGSRAKRPFLRNATVYGVVYFVLLIAVLHSARQQGFQFLLIFAPLVWGAAVLVWSFLPVSSFYDPGGKLSYSPKTSGILRLTFYSVLFVAINITEILSGWWVGGYVLLFWILPLVYVFPHLMLVREVFQHANADRGEISNSRVIHVNPVLRWALLGYGNDVHIVHHIYPNIPHYHLMGVHGEMCKKSQTYRDEVEETYGMIRGEEEQASVIEALAISRSGSTEEKETEG
ncbi:MAG: fatty acid desaturase [Verrucomicrobiales bacterium]|nr:fatty acid desaturase [Verrucomicrobiales bacterium]